LSPEQMTSEDAPQHSIFSPLPFAAGYMAGAVGVLVGHPLDTLKVRAQAGCSTVRTRALYAGFATPLLTMGGIQALNLGLYDNARRRLQALRGAPAHERAPLPVVGAAAAAAGVCISVLTCPQHRLKILQQSGGGGGGGGSGAGKGSTVSVWPLCRQLGLRGLFRGWGLTATCESLRGVYMVAYVALLRALEPASRGPVAQLGHNGGGSAPPASLENRVVAGAVAGVVGWACIYPVDSVKTVLMAIPPGVQAAPTAREVLQRLLREGGTPRLFRGLGVTLLRAGPVSGVLLPTFDLSLAALQRTFGGDARTAVNQ
jgi:solute carrier family 25 (mitochondrial carnitine/acylcarnitine transporter), member 20/29